MGALTQGRELPGAALVVTAPPQECGPYAVVTSIGAPRLFEASHSSVASATVRHPLSIVSECPRPRTDLPDMLLYSPLIVLTIDDDSSAQLDASPPTTQEYDEA